MSTKPICIIDVKNFNIRLFYYFEHFQKRNGTNLPLETCFQQMFGNIKKQAGYDCVFVWVEDCKLDNKYWRHEIYDLYKANRVQKDDNGKYEQNREIVIEQISQHKNSVHVKIPLIEADDLAYILLKTFRNPEINSAVSVDADWLQLISEGLVKKVFKKSETVTQYDSFELEIKCKKGDKSDNIPLVRGENAAAINRNRKLIMFNAIPQFVIDKVWDGGSNEITKIAELAGYEL